MVFLAFGSHCSAGVSLLIRRSLNAIANLVLADDGGRLVVVDVAVKSFEFRVVAIYHPNSVGEIRSFFRRFGPFHDDSKRLVLVGDWNAILDPKLDKDGLCSTGSDSCESSFAGRVRFSRQVLSGLLRAGDVDVANWFAFWPDSDLSGQSLRRADIDFVACPTSNWIVQTDPELFRASMRLAYRPCLAS